MLENGTVFRPHRRSARVPRRPRSAIVSGFLSSLPLPARAGAWTLLVGVGMDVFGHAAGAETVAEVSHVVVLVGMILAVAGAVWIGVTSRGRTEKGVVR
jgi:apolipoprotein N-acyltransferase